MVKSRTCFWLLGVALAFMGWPVGAVQGAQEVGPHHDEAGLFFVESIPSTDYPGGIQNWAIIQDDDGILYVANNQGLMIYDGEHWDMIEMPNASFVMSLAKSDEGRIYVGAQDEFGYVEPDDVGALHYVSLVDELDEQYQRFGDVRSTVATTEGVYFQSNDYLFRRNPSGSMEVWEGDTPFGNIFGVDDVLHVFQREIGLKTMRSDSLTLLPGTEALADESVQMVLPFQGDRLLVGTMSGGLFTYGEQGLAPLETEINDYLRENELYRAIRLSSGHWVVGTIRGGALLLQPNGELLRRIGRRDGLPDVMVLSIYEDDRGGVWLGSNTGLAHIDVPFAFTYFDYRLGFEGLGLGITRHEGRLYAPSTNGVFVLESGQQGQPARFEHIAGTEQLCFDILSTHAGLLATCGNGIFRVNGQRAERIDENIAYTLHQSSIDHDIVYLGLLDGLGWLQYGPEGWEKKGRVEAIDEPIRSIAEDRDGGLWLGTDYQGVRRVSFNGKVSEEARVKRFGTEDGLPGGLIYAHRVGDEIVFSTTQGFFRVREGSGTSFHLEVHEEYNEIIPGGQLQMLTIETDGEDFVWFFGQSADARGSTIILAERDPDGRLSPVQTPLQRVSGTSINAHYVGDEDNVWLSTQNGLLRYDETTEASLSMDFPVVIRGVRTIGSDSLLYGGTGSRAGTTTALRYRDNDLRFTYAAPLFTQNAPTHYRVWLEGFDDDWSPWTEETRRDYTNLPAGEYIFHVQAQSAYGLQSDAASYAFSVLGPWYRSWWAVTLFVMLAALLLGSVGYGVYWYRARKLRERNRVLEQRVRERTQALRQRTKTLERANLDLRAANEQKSEFLGVAAHDLKNPLSGIIESSSVLIEDARRLEGNALRKVVLDFMPLIHESSTRMLQIIEDLLQTHVLEDEESELYLERTNMVDLVYHVLRWNRTQAEHKDITLYFRPPEDCEAMVDETQMQRVLDNLVSNAIKFSPSGSAVKVRLDEDDGTVRISVTDEGPGLTEADKEKVFGKLQLLSARPTGGEHSSGLGLYIVRELVENHDGRVYVESEYGEGATFIVEVPTRLEETVRPAEPVAG